jgi:pterin-4a-carbinolamine dehydratase
VDKHGFGQSPAEKVVEDWEGFWNESDLVALLDFHVFNDAHDMLGTIVCDLGNTYLHHGEWQNKGYRA